MIDPARITGFDRDDGNARKNDQHGVTTAEAVQFFFNAPLLLPADVKHGRQESWHHALGRTDEGRLLHIMFTLRKAASLIRVISARDMRREERTIYERAD